MHWKLAPIQKLQLYAETKHNQSLPAMGAPILKYFTVDILQYEVYFNNASSGHKHQTKTL